MGKEHGTIKEEKLESVPKCPYLERNKNFKSHKKEFHPVVEFRSV